MAGLKNPIGDPLYSVVYPFCTIWRPYIGIGIALEKEGANIFVKNVGSVLWRLFSTGI